MDFKDNKIMIKKTDISFKDFWDAYALKRDRMAAERAWNRLPERDRRAAFEGIASYRKGCLDTGIRMMYAQGYLSHRRWEDEEETPETPKTETRSPEPGGMDKW